MKSPTVLIPRTSEGTEHSVPPADHGPGSAGFEDGPTIQIGEDVEQHLSLAAFRPLSSSIHAEPRDLSDSVSSPYISDIEDENPSAMHGEKTEEAKLLA